MSIRKSNDFGRDKYKNVCLIINGDIDDEMCTTTKYGFTDVDFLDFITWKKSIHQPTLMKLARKLALVFREKNAVVEGVPVTQSAVISEVIINHIGIIFYI